LEYRSLSLQSAVAGFDVQNDYDIHGTVSTTPHNCRTAAIRQGDFDLFVAIAPSRFSVELVQMAAMVQSAHS